MTEELKRKREREWRERVAAERERFENELNQQDIYLAIAALESSGGQKSVVEHYGFSSYADYEETLRNTMPYDEAVRTHMRAYRTQLDEEMLKESITEEAVEEAMQGSDAQETLREIEREAIERIANHNNQDVKQIAAEIYALPENIDDRDVSFSEKLYAIQEAVIKLKYSRRWSWEQNKAIEALYYAETKKELMNKLNEFRRKVNEDKLTEATILKRKNERIRNLRGEAKKELAKKYLYEATNTQYYQREEERAAQEVEKALNRGDYDTALAAQDRRIVMGAYARESAVIKKQVDSLVAKVERQLKTRTVKLPVSHRYWHRHVAYLLRIAKEDAVKPIGTLESIGDILSRLDASFDLDANEVFNPEILEERGSENNRQGYQGLRLGEFESAINLLNILYTTGKNALELKTIGGIDFDDAVNDIINESTSIANHMSTNRTYAGDDTGGLWYWERVAKIPGIGALLANGGQEFGSTVIKPEVIISLLGEKGYKYLYGSYERAAEQKTKLAKAYIIARDLMLQGYSDAERTAWHDEKYVFVTRFGAEKFSKEHIIAMALNLGNNTNRRRLIASITGKITEKDASIDVVNQNGAELLAFIEQHMTAKDWQLVQDTWDLLDSFWEDTAKIEEEMSGIVKKKVEAVPFTAKTKDGKVIKMRGGYYPIAYNPAKSSRAAEQEVESAAKGAMTGYQVLGTGRSFVKARSNAEIDRPLDLTFKVLARHSESVIHNIAYRKAARDAYRLINDKRLEEFIKLKLGAAAYNRIKEYVVDVWSVNAQSVTNTNAAVKNVGKAISFLHSNSVTAVMAWRIWPALENSSNFAILADELGGPEKAAAAVFNFYSDFQKNRELVRKSGFMEDRIENIDRDVSAQQNAFNPDNKAIAWLKENGFKPLLYTDLALGMPLWVATYQNVYQVKIGEVEAESKANLARQIATQEAVDKLKGQLNAAKRELEHIAPDRKEQQASRERIKELERELYEATLEHEKSLRLAVLSKEEILKEAEKRSVFAADKAIRNSFGSSRTQDMPSAMRSKDPLMRALTSFMSFFNTQLNAVYEAHIRSKYHMAGGKQAITRSKFYRRIVYRYIMTAFISTALMTMLRLMFAVPADDEDEDLVERFLTDWFKNTVATGTGGMYGVRELVALAMLLGFEGTDYGRGLNYVSLLGRAGNDAISVWKLFDAKAERDAKIAERQAKHEEKLRKLKGKKREEYLESLKYQQPLRPITYSAIAQKAASSAVFLTASKFGLSSTPINAIFRTVENLNDDTDYYSNEWKHYVWSIIFDKRLVPREIPKDPRKEEKKKKKEQKSKAK